MRDLRVTFGAAVATMAAALSLVVLLQGLAWLAAGIGAIAVVALAGGISRGSNVRASLVAAGLLLIASVPMLAGRGWPGRITALVLVTIAVLGVTGKRPARAFAVLATYYSCLLIYLNVVFAGAESYIRIIPSPSSVALLSGLPSKATAQFKFAPPVPPSRPVEFFAAAGIGIVAIIVDIIAVRLRRPALAGLPLLVLFSVPVASDLKTFGAAQSVTFAAALAGYLSLLSADGRQRLRLWGRLVTVRSAAPGDDGPGPDTRDLAATGRRIGLAAVCLAIVVPLAVPAKPHDIFVRPGNGDGSGSGQVGSSVASPLVKVQQQLDESKPLPVLTYSTTAAINPEENYLQQWVLNYSPAASTWLPVSGGTLAVRGADLPATIPGLTSAIPARRFTDNINLDFAEPGPLPVPYAPVRVVDHGASLTEEPGTLMVLNGALAQSNLQFTVTSREINPSKHDLAAADLRNLPISIGTQYGSYTGPDTTQLRKLALEHTSNAQDTLQEAVYLQNWLTSTAFKYTLKPHFSSTRHWLLEFLTTRRRGDCQQFAWAYAVLARLVGIPSRVVVGYTAGSQNANGRWLVTTADAHAWPELYFASVGWIRFEPTPAGSTGQGTAVAPSYSIASAAGQPGTNPGGGGQGTTPGGQQGSQTRTGGKLPVRPTDTGRSGGQAGTSSQTFNIGLAVAIVVFLLLIAPASGRWLTRRRRWIAASSDSAMSRAVWRELLDCLTDYGYGTLPSESPRGLVTRISADAGFAADPQEALRRLGTAEERARYSRQPQPGAGLRADLATVRRALTARSGMRQRLRALLLPPSTMAAVTSGLQSVGHATSWIDSGLPSISRRRRRTAN
jgi:hypothetical protein